jgi:hypothetical protein
MNKIELLIIFVSVLLFTTTAALVGHHYGGIEKQRVILQECKENGVYLDRRILLECRVNEPARKSV